MTDFSRTSDHGPELPDIEDDRERPDVAALERAASAAFERYMSAKNRRGLVRCPACVGTGDGSAFLTSCSACSGTGCVTPEVAREMREHAA